MKSTYSRPRIVFENFGLSNGASSGCEGIANLAEYECSVMIPELGYSIFNDMNICEVTPVGDDDTLCYHAPSDWNNVYSS